MTPTTPPPGNAWQDRPLWLRLLQIALAIALFCYFLFGHIIPDYKEREGIINGPSAPASTTNRS